tara:strand:- start:250 stop:501 length:252 start_codon:yes stop_codon:yes gene_type:complete
MGVLIDKWLSSVDEWRVSSAAIRFTDLKISAALVVISPKFPIGVATTYNFPFTFYTPQSDPYLDAIGLYCPDAALRSSAPANS